MDEIGLAPVTVEALLPSIPSDDVLLSEKDFYVRMKELEAQLETLNIQENILKMNRRI